MNITVAQYEAIGQAFESGFTLVIVLAVSALAAGELLRFIRS